ncbi:MAG: hypothetical protein K0S07_385 [Chlamydiales bacterium]|jgi:hypothetical protein|nr:hypothetical protein [Chlamydiales bacterium]
MKDSWFFFKGLISFLLSLMGAAILCFYFLIFSVVYWQEPLKELIENRCEQEIAIGTIAYHFPLSLSIDSLEIGQGRQTLSLKNLVGSFSFKKLLLKQTFSPQMYVEEAALSVEEAESLDVDFDDLPLEALCSFLEHCPINIELSIQPKEKVSLPETGLQVRFQLHAAYQKKEQLLSLELLLKKGKRQLALMVKSDLSPDSLLLNTRIEDSLGLFQKVSGSAIDFSHLYGDILYDREREGDEPLASLSFTLLGTYPKLIEDGLERFQMRGQMLALKDACHVQSLSASSRDGDLSASFQIDRHGLIQEAALAGRIYPSLLQGLDGIQREGLLTFNGILKGEWNKPHCALACHVPPNTIQGIAMPLDFFLDATLDQVLQGSLSLKSESATPIKMNSLFMLNLQNNTFSLETLDAHLESLKVNGSFSSTPDGVKTQVDFVGDLALLNSFAALNVEGSATGSLSATFPPKEPPALIAQVQISPLSFGISHIEEAHVTASYQKGQMQGSIQAERCTFGHLLFDEVEGSLATSGTDSYTFQGHATCLKEIFELGLEGSVALSPDLVHLFLQKGYLSVKDERIESSPFHLSASPSHLTCDAIRFRSHYGEASLDLGITEQLFSAELQARHFPIHPFSLLALPIPLDGHLSAHLKLTGVQGEMSGFCQADIENVLLSLLKKRGPSSFPPVNFHIEGKLQEENLSFSSSLSSKDSQGKWSGALHLIKDEAFAGYWPHLSLPYRLSLDTKMESAFSCKGSIAPYLEWFLPDAKEAKAHLDGAFTLNGSLKDPICHGQASLSDAYFESLSSGLCIDKITAKLLATGGRTLSLVGEGFSGKEGKVSGSGILSLKKFLPYHMDFQLSKVTILDLPDMTASSNGQLSLVGSLRSAKLSGELNLIRADILIPPPPPNFEMVEVLYLMPEKKKNKRKAPFASSFPVEYDLKLNVVHNAFLEGRGLSSEWQGRLHLTGMDSDIKYAGSFNIRRGEFAIGGRPFKIEEGSIIFSDTLKESPLNVIASLQLNTIYIMAEIRGPINNPIILLQSRPSMPEKDILSWVLFNKSAGQISPAEAWNIANAALQINGGYDIELLRRLRKGLNLDRFEISANPTDPRNTLSLQAGKYLFNDVFISINKVFNSELNAFSIELELKKHIKLQAEIAEDRQESRLRIQWQKRY